MKRLTLICCAVLMSIASTVTAGNTKQTVTSVTQAVDITDDVDYTITSSTNPFATSGSVNLANTEHAVVILAGIKPSIVLSKYMSFIYIDGQPAKNGENCQVKMYGAGAIVFPYAADIHPLTTFSEPGFGGESCNDYGLENTGGFMNSLTTAKLNNRIRSFKLKRGYMVTFALGLSGWGYSRCFIADQEDLEMANMPANMDARVSSYRVFHWYNAQKKGLASDANKNTNDALNTAWCYDWGQGNASLLPDHEWVPHHIYEDWPSPSTCGSVTGSCHMKTNNEPGNKDDDHPQDVATVLGNWQNLMRTGMRLCSESSHDGSMSHLKAFIDSIDARGWRCDILDMHCYWASGFNNLTWYSDYYGNGRPIWVTEWVWGASWNNNGIFATDRSYSTANQQANYNGVKPILDALNANTRVERYAYWNSEADASKIYKDGATSILGKYYASMNSGLGYNKANEYIPKIVYTTPSGLTLSSYDKNTKLARIAWNDGNGDMLDSMVIEYLRPNTTRYTTYRKITLRDQNSASAATYNAAITLDDIPGLHTLRIASYPIGSNSPRRSGTITISVSQANGNETMQYGILELPNTEAISTDFSTPFTSAPVIFMGVQTNKNTGTVTSSLISTITAKAFTYQPLPWAQSGTQTYSNAEQIPFLAIKTGSYSFAGIDIEVGQEKVRTDTLQVTFAKPFPEGTTPVVIAEINKPTLKENSINLRIWDISNTGFKAIALYESGVGRTIAVKQTMSYLAMTPGSANLSDGITITAGISNTPLYGTTYRPILFNRTETDGTIDPTDTLHFRSPYLFGTFQTFNIKTAAQPRRSTDMTATDSEYGTLTYGTRIRRVVDTSGTNSSIKNTSATADTFGWIVISQTTTTYNIADVNQDGSIDTQDVLAIYEFMQTSDDTTPVGTEDVNKDGRVDTGDVLAVYEYMQEE